jgi:uncharacterized protein DUF1828
MDCQELKARIAGWFNDELECRPAGRALMLTLPILKPDGDALEIGVEPTGSDLWKLSDLGNVQEHFYLAGLDLYSDSARADEFAQIVKTSGISQIENELLSTAASEQLASAVFEFAQALQYIFALQFASKVQALSRDFATIVAQFLSEHRASYTIPPDNIPGKTGSWKFNFVLNHVRAATLVKTLSLPKATAALATAEKTVFEINDIRQLDPQSPSMLVIADDEGERAKFWKPRVMRVFGGYDVRVLRFNDARAELVNFVKQYAT